MVVACEQPVALICQKCDSSTFVFDSSARLQKFYGPQLMEERNLEKGSIFNARYRVNDGLSLSIWNIIPVAPPAPVVPAVPKPVFVPIEEEKVKEPEKAPEKKPEEPKRGISLRLKRNR